MEREHVLGVWAQTLPGSKRATRAWQWVASLGELLEVAAQSAGVDGSRTGAVSHACCTQSLALELCSADSARKHLNTPLPIQDLAIQRAMVAAAVGKAARHGGRPNEPS